MSPILTSHKNRIFVIAINEPPVNAASHAVRKGLVAAIEEFESTQEAEIAVIYGVGRTFVAGADIREFGKPSQAPILPDVCQTIENASKPVVAVLHGSALGGGFEIALAAHYRVILPGGKIGLPEVTLGILPGAGGTQRLPRLAGLKLAAEMATSGKPIGAEAALAAGIVDRITNLEDPEAAGVEYANFLLETGATARPTCQQPAPDPGSFDATILRAKLTKTARGQIAPLTCLDTIIAGAGLPFDKAMALERKAFTTLMDSPQRQGMIHAFFSERAVFKVPEIAGITPRSVASVGVVGGGTMGCGIAAAMALGGLTATVVERDADSAGRARQTISDFLEKAGARGKKADPNAIRVVTDFAALSTSDLVVEAVFEDLAVKKDVFAKLDQTCKPGAVLATNTSYLDVNAIANATSRPEVVIGLHFFSPAHIMKLLEIVVAQKTAPDVVATAFAMAKRLRKTPVKAGVCDGFIGNRILDTYRTALDHMVLDGATPYQIDTALVNFGLAMGPFAVGDMSGLDIAWATRKRKAPSRHPKERIATYADKMCEAGWLGVKAGKGFYLHGANDPRGTPNPDVLALIEADRAVQQRRKLDFSDQDITERYMAAMVNEAAKIVGEGIAQRPSDVDVTLLSGYGFPRHRGGPMKYADMVGLPEMLARIERYAEEDDHFWRPAPLLVELVSAGRFFEDLND